MPQVLRGFGMMLAIVPITNLALGTLPPERLKNASGLFNLTRNLGGAVGLAALNTVLDNRIDLHFARLHEAITWSRQPVTGSLCSGWPRACRARTRRTWRSSSCSCWCTSRAS